MLFYRYPREKTQGVAFEKTIAPVDLIISLECKPVKFIQYFTFDCDHIINILFVIFYQIGNDGVSYFETSL